MASVPPALPTPQPTPEPAQIIITFPQHQTTLENGGQYSPQAYVIPETVSQFITWTITSEHDGKTTIENDILTISSTETNSVLNLTATSINNQLTIEVIPIDPPPKEVLNTFIFNKDNPPRYTVMPWMKEPWEFDDIFINNFQTYLNYIVPTE